MVNESFFGNLSHSHVSRKLTSAPLASSLVGEFNGLQKGAFEGVLVLVGVLQVTHGVEVGLEGDFTSWNVLVASDLGGNQRVADVGDVDQFIPMRAILAHPKTFQVELRQAGPGFNCLIVMHLSVDKTSILFGFLVAADFQHINELGILLFHLSKLFARFFFLGILAFRNGIQELNRQIIHLCPQIPKIVAKGYILGPHTVIFC
mmetsp:Transcript_39747/g.82638  ORF Transcript_39747/g.82638 Transcript_39747/m.82638 type:complete len:204 (+) Transcript_39747:828-1439(+)